VQQTDTIRKFTLKTDSSFSIFSLGSMKLKNSLHSSITLILLDLNNFIKNRVTAKSSDLTSCLATEKHSNPYTWLLRL